jgi:hemolysin D
VKFIQPPDGGVIRNILVKEGDLVTEGQNLFELDPRIAQADLESAAEKAKQLEVEIARLRGEYSDKPSRYAQEFRGTDRVLVQGSLRAARDANFRLRYSEALAIHRSKTSAFAAAKSQLGGYELRIKVAKDKEASAAGHAGWAVSKFDYLTLVDQLMSLQKDYENQKEIVISLEHDANAAKERIDQIVQERRSLIMAEISDKVTQLELIRRELDKAAVHVGNNYISSPVKGRVQRLVVTALGAVVAPTDTLAIVVPEGTPFVMESYLASQDRGFVKVGQRVDVKIDAYRYELYGAIPARIIWISPDAETQTSNVDIQPSDAKNVGKDEFQLATKLTFRVHAKPEMTGIMVGTELMPFQFGMTAQVDIFTDKRRVIDFLLFPTQRAIDDGLTVR